jgi:rRNA maturation protein Rpf1
MSIDLSQVVAAEMMINRLTLVDGTVLKFMEKDPNATTAGSEYIVRLTLDANADWDSQDVANIQNGDDFLVVRVLDYAGFQALADKCDTIEFESSKYTIKKRFKPKTATRVWTFKCLPQDDF